MSAIYEARRYLTDFDSWRTGHVFADVLVVGSGVAGMRAAIEAAAFVGNILLISKTVVEETATRYAQGGVAAARAPDDSARLHVEDTMRVGCGLNNSRAVELLADDASTRIDELIEWGMKFDQSGGDILLGREGGHSFARILHAGGDATGRELVRVLGAKVRSDPRIRVFENCFLIDLITHDDRCVGAVTHHPKYGHQIIWAASTILAGGGAGRVYRETTNPEIATGDGFAAAYRAGATLADLEFVQFHPTALYVAGANRALISEAVRGEGALLVDREGNHFMPNYHPDAELAPRDVVSRAIFRQMQRTHTHCVYLDVRRMGAKAFADRFPGITRLCAQFQIDVGRDLIPVRPAAHYMIGGVLTDLDCRTSVDGLYCCGENACSGLHGANRLASNSLLEGLVFGRIAGEKAAFDANGRSTRVPHGNIRSQNDASQRTELDLTDIANSLRSIMWRNVGVERTADRLIETGEIIDFWGHYVLDKTFHDPRGWETQNMLTLSRLIAAAALFRPRSIGVHFRLDDPNPETLVEPTHSSIRNSMDGPALSECREPFG